MGVFSRSALEPFLKGSFICRSGKGADNQRVESLDCANGDVHRTAWAAIARAALTILILTAWTLPPAWGGKDDHERARAAVQAGEVLPLPILLERLERTHPGQVLELELEREVGLWRYEIKLLQANGQLLKLKVDARTAQVLEVRNKDRRSDQRTDKRSDQHPDDRTDEHRNRSRKEQQR
jgi:hypothetical protein